MGFGLPGLCLWLLEATDVEHRLQLLTAPSQDSSLANRVNILDVVSGNFDGFDRIFGVGLGRFPHWFYAMTDVPDMPAHIEVLWIYVEGGVIGCMLLAGAMLLFTNKTISLVRQNRLGWQPAVFLLLSYWPQMGPLEMTNPIFFYQAVMVVYAIIGAMLGEVRPLGDDICRNTRWNYQLGGSWQKTLSHF